MSAEHGPKRARDGRGTAKRLVAAGVAVLLVGCASGPNMRDPFETYNRTVYAFNEGLDRVAFRPISEAYFDLLPQFVRTGVSNFFGNLGDAWTGANNLLQGKGRDGLDDFARVLINSTLGLGGLLEVAADAGLERHDEDFGQTLGRWGVGGGPFIVWPFFGGRTLRDSFGLAADYHYDLIRAFPNDQRMVLRGARFVDLRASLLPAERVLETAALDQYAYLREAYLQRRKYLIYDGRPPKEDFDDDDEEDAKAAPAKPSPPSTGPAEKR